MGTTAFSITAAGTTANLVEGNFIGTDSTGTKVEGNKANGVEIATAANTNTVGGTAAGAGNLIANNTVNGVLITTNGNLVAGDTILSNGTNGVEIAAGASANTLGGTTAGAGNTIALNGNDGVLVTAAGTTANVVQGNFIGTDSTGTKAEGNTTNGVEFAAGANANTVGGTAMGAGNVISANLANGILVTGTTTPVNLVQGNFIGTDQSGLKPLGNGLDGVRLDGASNYTIGADRGWQRQRHLGQFDRRHPGPRPRTATVVVGNLIGTDKNGATALGNGQAGVYLNNVGGNTVGGTTTAARNVISGNTGDGVVISGALATMNLVEGNYIGIDQSGLKPLGNGLDGVRLDGASNDSIGGTAAGAGNVISGNPGNGIQVLAGATATVIVGNLIGTDKNGATALGNGQAGVYLNNVGGNTVGGTTTAARNVISGNTGDGVLITGALATMNLVEGNYIGTDSTGTNAVGNKTNGVEFAAGANANTVGGTATGAGNVISANLANGILVTGTTTPVNLVQGNFIGTDQSGLKPLGNGLDGVRLDGASNYTIGGTAAGAGNVISANSGNGIQVLDGATATVIVGNLIGTDETGATALGNGHAGVYLNNVGGNTVGGTTAAARNVISGNTSDGVLISGALAAMNLLEGNYIGTDSTGTKAVGNQANGVEFAAGANANTVGGTATGAGNVISANLANGILVTGTTTPVNLVQGNFIGTDQSGLKPLGNGLDGVRLDGASNYTIGGTAAGAGNVISANSGNGIQVLDGATATVIVGNLIGTDKNGATALGNGQAGVYLNNVGGNTVGGTTTAARNVISGNTGDGVLIAGALATMNLVEGNDIGTDSTGTKAVGNLANGVELTTTANANVIGGTAAGAGNIISSNGTTTVLGDGVLITTAGTANLVEGNFIGTDSTGALALPNTANGVEIASGASANIIGPGNVILHNAVNGVLITSNANTVTGNVISLNTNDGVKISGTGVTDNLVVANEIGTDATGTKPEGNLANGVEIAAGALSNTIGGTAAAAGNIISSNGTTTALGDGVLITGPGTATNLVEGNHIGTDPTGALALPNTANGVEIAMGANGNIIGPGNVILHNGANGVLITTNGNTVTGNVISLNTNDGVKITGTGVTGNNVFTNEIGTDATGTTAEGNLVNGVEIAAGALSNTIGGTAAGAGNIIASNGTTTALGDGILITGPGTATNLVEGNHIGTDPTGALALPNTANGVEIAAGANTNTVGGTTAAAANLIANNAVNGVLITTSGNLVAGNTIVLNGNDGVLITAAGTTANLVEGNFIGTDSAGTQVEGNKANGVEIAAGANTNTVGGTTAAAANLIANNTVNGVLITTKRQPGRRPARSSPTGSMASSCRRMMACRGVDRRDQRPAIGRTGQTRSAVNGNDGVLITAAGTTANLVEGNFIGTDSTGTKVEGNKANGVEIAAAADTNTVGGTAAAAGNLIANNTLNGVLITTSGNLVAGNTIVLNGNDGVLITAAGTTANLVEGNFIGTDSTGTKVQGNKAKGVEIAVGANTNTGGGTTTAAANLIANNTVNGVLITTSGNLVAGNTILTNGINGVELAGGASANTIGGTAAGAGNTIAVNGNDGVLITAAGTTANLVEGNFIGTDSTGTKVEGNKANGVEIAVGANTNTVGGTTAAAGNLIANNTHQQGFDHHQQQPDRRRTRSCSTATTAF